jgi:peptidoglycan LD-endopeptidase LytH
MIRRILNLGESAMTFVVVSLLLGACTVQGGGARSNEVVPVATLTTSTTQASVATSVVEPSSVPTTEVQPNPAEPPSAEAASDPSTTSVPDSTAPLRQAPSTSVASTLGEDRMKWAQPELNYVYPVPVHSGYHPTHSGYAATDVFARCGAPIISPVHGVVVDFRRFDPWDRAVDDPFTRGGLFVSIFGDDGVRYYMSHFERLADYVMVGVRVVPGEYLGEMGSTGRSSACHLHVGISPMCESDEWWVRRGVVWPYVYFDAWRSGAQTSPADEVKAWFAAHPDACSRT